jgi:hypothetical protein
MEVDFNPGRNMNVGSSQSVNRRGAIQPADSTMSFSRTQSLEKSVKSIPQVRPEKVAAATALVADPQYPSTGALNKLAGLFAGNLASQED